MLIAGACVAQDGAPKAPEPVKEHEWLGRLVGEWESSFEATTGPGQEPMRGKGSERVRKIGRFWVVAEGKADVMGMPMESLLTLGYDAGRKRYVATWVDSMQNHMWKYEGTVDEAGKVLTLETEGPNPMLGGKVTRFRETMELKGKDERVFTSSMMGPDGKWVRFMTVNYKRKG